MNRPKSGTKKYYDYIDKCIALIEESLPFVVYGYTDYVLAGYWKMKDNSVYKEPSRIPLEIFETILNTKFE